MNLPVEALELDAPIRVHRVALRADSGGAGAQFRGGLGIVREYEVLDGEVTLHPSRRAALHRPEGRAGGRTGPWPAPSSIAPTAREETMPSKIVTTLQAGDRVVIETAGGGGYGDPARRDPEQVGLDLADGKISTKGAEIYDRARKGAR